MDLQSMAVSLSSHTIESFRVYKLQDLILWIYLFTTLDEKLLGGAVLYKKRARLNTNSNARFS
jgi:hypothetical protein